MNLAYNITSTFWIESSYSVSINKMFNKTQT